MFKNEANLEIIWENKDIIDSIYEFISSLDKYCYDAIFVSKDEYETAIYLIIKSIVEYGKEAYNCMKRGDFFALSMLTRAIIENYTVLITIGDHYEEKLYKYWIMWSYANALEKHIKGSEKYDYIKSLLTDCIKASGLTEELMENKDFASDYGWTIGLGQKKSRYQLAAIIDEEINSDYKKLNDFIHGTSLTQKQLTFTFETTPLYIIITMFTYLVKASGYYFDDELDEKYNALVLHIYQLFDEIVEDRGYNE